MSKKVVTKKAQAAPTENGTSAAATDVRVAHQLRVLETVAAGEDEKKYSPRTEGHIQRLSDVLDFYEYSRADIAGLVRRCHHDENQIQVAVANIIEDRANHEKEEWGTVKNKKQAKEERKIKEEEEKKEQKKEQERLLKEEKQRREAERKAAKDAERGRRGKGGKNGEDAAASLPPDPAILFAGTKPTGEKETGEKWDGQWWESSGDKWNGKSWEWQESWHGEEWSGNKAQNDNWWGGQWEKAGSRKKSYKEKKDAPPVQEEEEAEGDFWDMPDTAQPAEGGLDQWTLGRLPGHERENELVPKAMPDNALTVEALERGHLAAPTIAPTAPPSSKPMEIPQPDLLAALGAPVASSSGPEERAERGEKGRGKGKKGKERDKGQEGDKERLERIDRSDDPRRQAVEQVGEVVTVRKHSSMGCAVVSMTDVRVRQAIVAEGNECTINGIKVQIKPHTNKETKEEVLTDLFVAWGRQVEKVNPLSEEKIAKYFDTKYKEIAAGWKAAEDERREAEEREKVRAQEQQRQELVLRQRTEERRRYEQEEEQKRRQHEAEQQQKWMSQQWMQQAGGTLPQAGARIGTEQFAQLQQQPQAVQWNNSQQWMQAAMYQAQAAQGWQMAQRMQGMSGQAQQENPDWQAYYRQYMADQRGQAGGTYAQQPAAGYTNQQAFNYGAYSRGERI